MSHNENRLFESEKPEARTTSKYLLMKIPIRSCSND